MLWAIGPGRTLVFGIRIAAMTQPAWGWRDVQEEFVFNFPEMRSSAQKTSRRPVCSSTLCSIVSSLLIVVFISGKQCDRYKECDDFMLCQSTGVCLSKQVRLLGQRCSPNYGDVCVQATGKYSLAHENKTWILQYPTESGKYTANSVNCNAHGICDCNAHFIRDGASCRHCKYSLLCCPLKRCITFPTVRINERGCSNHHQCQQGAMCFQNRCRCPPDYKPYRDFCKPIWKPGKANS